MADFKEGDVVVVTGKLDTRVRDVTNTLVTGTVWFITKDKEVIVLLEDGNFFRGALYQVAPVKEQV